MKLTCKLCGFEEPLPNDQGFQPHGLLPLANHRKDGTLAESRADPDWCPCSESLTRIENGCVACQSKGWLFFTDNTVQRCDDCGKFPSDLEAASQFFKDNYGWCMDGEIKVRRYRNTVFEKAISNPTPITRMV